MNVPKRCASRFRTMEGERIARFLFIKQILDRVIPILG